MGRTIAIVSGKGGTGKTMFAANLGATLAKMGRQTILIDMDTGLRNLDLYLGLENKVVYDVNDVMNGLCRIRQAVIKDKTFPGLSFMAASPRRDEGHLTPLHVKVLCETHGFNSELIIHAQNELKKLAEKYDYVILDAAAGVDDGLDMVLGGADEAIIVMNPEISSKRDSELVTEILRSKGMQNIYYIINKINIRLINAGFAPSMEDVTRGIRNRVIGLIREDENIHISTNLGLPVVFKDNTYIAENFRKIAKRIDDMKN